MCENTAFLLLPQERSLGTACSLHAGFLTGSGEKKKKVKVAKPTKGAERATGNERGNTVKSSPVEHRGSQ